MTVIKESTGGDPPRRDPDLRAYFNNDVRHTRMALPCGCALEVIRTEGAVEFTFCDDHRRTKIARRPDPKFWDGPVCARELKPGVPREGHTLLDHKSYEEDEPQIDDAAHERIEREETSG